MPTKSKKLNAKANLKSQDIESAKPLPSEKRLRHFISFKYLKALLRRSSLTLVRTTKWEDKNDLKTLQFYEKQFDERLFVMCLTGIAETFHHWKIYGGKGKGGKMCVVFHREPLLEAIKKTSGVEADYVKYLNIREVRKKPLSKSSLPFVKRVQFADEKELRIIWRGSTKKIKRYCVPIPMNCIEQIVFNPWIANSKYEKKRGKLDKIIRGAKGNVEVKRSHLVHSPDWINAVQKHFP